MPFDSKNFVETKADSFTLDALIAWLETKDPDEVYGYTENERCLLAQYIIENHICLDPSVVSGGWRNRSDMTMTFNLFPGDENHRSNCFLNNIAVNGPWTFGAALSRAREFKVRQP